MKAKTNKPYIIAEIGVNYYDTAKALNITPLEAAKLYIDAIAEAGIDCAKFQSYKANTIVSKNSPAYWDTRKEPTKTQHELFKKHDSFNYEEYKTLSEYTHSKGLHFTSTPFDYNSADYLAGLVDFYKISSSDMTNLPFIRHIAKKGKPVYISAGASYMHEVDQAISILKEESCPDIALFHCMLSYPTAFENANLRVIQTLKRFYPELTIGYSDHVIPDESMTTLLSAYFMGADIIEKHFTLDKSLPGNDHYHAGDPEDFKKAIRNFNLVKTILGSNEKKVYDCELIPRREARRSLVLTKDMKQGEIITETDIMAKRPGTGIPPYFADVVIGRSVKTDLCEDTILTWKMI